MARRIVLVALIVGALGWALWHSRQVREPLHVSGFIEADEIRVGSRVGGRVARVPAVEGRRVVAGEPLVELEPFDLEARRAQASAELAARDAELARLRAGFRSEEIAQAEQRRAQAAARLEEAERGPRPQEIAAARAQLDQVLAEARLAREDHERRRKLFEQRVLAREEMDTAETRLRTAEAVARTRREELGVLEEGTRREAIEGARAQLAETDQALALLRAGYRSEEITQAEAARDAAAAALCAVETQLAELVIKAPAPGIIEAVDLQPGDMIAAGAPALSLMDTRRLWVRAYVPESRLRFQVGARVAVSTDSYPDRRFAGRIAFIARQAEFTPNNVQTPEDRSQQVLRIKVELLEGLDVLYPGMAADVWLDSADGAAASAAGTAGDAEPDQTTLTQVAR